MKYPFHTRKYESYDKYVEHQVSKYNGEIPWLKNYEKFYKVLLKSLLKHSGIDTSGKSCLCIGARQGTEVEVFVESGSFAVGIDLNPGKENRYVVTGDGSTIQYPDSSIDIVYTNALDHFLEIDKTLDEIKRVLKPGGYFIFLIGTPNDAKIDKHGSTYWDDINEVLSYLSGRYGYELSKRYDVGKTKWFSDYVVMKNVSSAKLAVVYNPDDYKLNKCSYSKTYSDMLTAVTKRFSSVTTISDNCSAEDIEADVIIFFDPHSTHHIEINGIEKHSAVKYEYMNDPHQPAQTGLYPNRQRFHKLAAADRCKRAMARGVNYIITPSVWGYDKYLAPYLDKDMMLWFPSVPADTGLETHKLTERSGNIICNGHLWQGTNGFRPYEFRKWASEQKGVTYVPHYVRNRKTPVREDYLKMVSYFKAGVAACEYYPVAKYFEIPLAGCVLFAQKCEDFDRLGFVHGENCVVVNKGNLNKLIPHFLENYEDYQRIADAGRKHVEDNWTARHFANHIFNHTKGVIDGHGHT